MSQPFKLYRLQQIDSQLDWTRARLREIEAALKDSPALRQAQQNEAEASGRLKEALQALRRAEDNVRQQRLKIEQNESTLYGGKVRNPKELQDLQNEIASLKRFLAVLEDRQLEAMIAEEEARSTHKCHEDKLQAEQQLFAQQSEQLNQEKERLLKEVDRYEDERRATIPTIPVEDLSLYDQLRHKRAGIAVAKITDRACSACGSTLSAALLHAARSPNQLNRCETCGRILYIG